ncbi:MAG: DUF423 domain-containing protein [Chitinophagaceae bacterium]|nr:DUF423 domain-containing protein [Chitinophagaceae bacterium]
MHRGFLITAALLAALAVILGAFGAHGLKQIVPPDTISTFETGVRYHFYHSLALFAAGILYERYRKGWVKFAGIAFILGIALFSGSLYLLTLLKATETAGLRGIGIITPFGGLFFIAGWIALAIAVSLRPWRTE